MPRAGAFAPLCPPQLSRKGAQESILNKFSMGLSCPCFPAYGGVDLAGYGGWRDFLQGAAWLVQGGFGRTELISELRGCGRTQGPVESKRSYSLC